jgi:hypothetical protein
MIEWLMALVVGETLRDVSTQGSIERVSAIKCQYGVSVKHCLPSGVRNDLCACGERHSKLEVIGRERVGTEHSETGKLGEYFTTSYRADAAVGLWQWKKAGGCKQSACIPVDSVASNVNGECRNVGREIVILYDGA